MLSRVEQRKDKFKKKDEILTYIRKFQHPSKGVNTDGIMHNVKIEYNHLLKYLQEMESGHLIQRYRQTDKLGGGYLIFTSDFTPDFSQPGGLSQVQSKIEEF